MSFTIKVGPGEPLSLLIESGVNEKLVPFCVLRINGRGAGQLNPEEVRAMALQWLEAAEAAESDAIVMAELIETAGLDMPTAGAFIASLRERRKA